jgi:transcriptional regulator with PAS, ATPase and Fis domain
MEKLELKAPELSSMIKAVAPALAETTPIMIFCRDDDGLDQSMVWPEGEVFLKDKHEAIHLEPLMNNSGRPGLCHHNCCLGGLTESGELLVITSPDPFREKDLPLMRLLWLALAMGIKNQRKIAELTEGLEFGQNLIRSMYSGFLVLSPDLTVLNANRSACDLLRTTEDQLIGNKLSNFVLSKLLISQIFTTGKAIQEQDVFIQLADRNVHIQKTAVPIFGKDGQVIAALDHFREIKETRHTPVQVTSTSASFTFDDIIHESQPMAEAIAVGQMAAENSLSVLITGESGTGKELFAHAIHLASSRRQAPFVVIDCASIPGNLVASELFGYMEGAFTGSRKGGMPGKFELAYGGTIFLDELGELPLDIQPQFLRVLQNREVRRLGGKQTLPVDVRVIAATNCDLPLEVKKGNFREDLYYRLNVLPIHVPPLRARHNDILLLAHYFLEKYGYPLGKKNLVFSDNAKELLVSHSWPGNVRELENAVSLAVHLCHAIVEPRHLRLPVSQDQRAIAGIELPAKGNGYNDQPRVYSIPMVELPPKTTDFSEQPHISSIKDIEERAFRDTIAACGGNISKAAKKLGVARSTVYKKIASWN